MIDILMATYNGEKHIEAQLLSLISQTFKAWRLLIHDDGSTDNTIDVLKHYASIDDRIILVEDKVTFGNAGANFLHLMKMSKQPFTIFCDQDDVWFERKLELLHSCIANKFGPSAAYCNAFGYDGTKITTQQVSLIERSTLKDSLFLNSGVQGCSLIFNKELRDRLLEYPEYIYMHDHYITMGAITFGTLEYLDLSLMLYRQHDKSVTDAVPVTFFDRLKSFFNSQNPILDRKHYESNMAFFDFFRSEMRPEDRELFLLYKSFPNKGLLGRLRIVLKGGFKIGNGLHILLIKVLFRKVI